jgi:hypothetical protein
VAQVSKRKLSGSTDGRAVKVAATASAGTLIHTAVTGVVAGTFDEIWLDVYNSSASAVVLTIQWGGTSTPDDDIKITVPSLSGLVPVVVGNILQNGSVVRAYAGTANVLTIHGYVNAITA